MSMSQNLLGTWTSVAESNYDGHKATNNNGVLGIQISARFPPTQNPTNYGHIAAVFGYKIMGVM